MKFKALYLIFFICAGCIHYKVIREDGAETTYDLEQHRIDNKEFVLYVFFEANMSGEEIILNNDNTIYLEGILDNCVYLDNGLCNWYEVDNQTNINLEIRGKRFKIRSFTVSQYRYIYVSKKDEKSKKIIIKMTNYPKPYW